MSDTLHSEAATDQTATYRQPLYTDINVWSA